MADHAEPDKLERILSAARRHFAETGYDGTTLRDIARTAKVPLGTLSFFATTKRELVLLLFQRTLPDVIIKGQETAHYEGSIVRALLDLFAPTYAAYAAQPHLFRTVLRENVVETGSRYADEVDRLREATLDVIRKLMNEAVRHGEIRGYLDVNLAAHTVFSLFYSAVRQWLATPQPSVAAGLEDFAALLDLLLTGLSRAVATDDNRKNNWTKYKFEA